MKRYETPVPARSDALKVRFHSIRTSASPLVITLLSAFTLWRQ